MFQPERSPSVVSFEQTANISDALVRLEVFQPERSPMVVREEQPSNIPDALVRLLIFISSASFV